MKSVFIVVQKITMSTGHGQADTFFALSRTGQWDEHFAPVYTTKAEANIQKKILGGGEIVELLLLEKAAP